LLFKQRLRVAAKKQIGDNQNNSANSAANDNPSPASGPAFVFDVLAFPPPLPKHR
jgi:hypothetical protein